MATQPPAKPLGLALAGAPPVGADPAVAAAVAAAFQAAAGGGPGGGGPGGMPPPPPGNPPPPPGGALLPPASPGPIARAIWAKVPPAMRHRHHAGEEMANYLAVMTGGTPNPESLRLAIATTSVEPMCFLTAR
jgi:hypothetical protein